MRAFTFLRLSLLGSCATLGLCTPASAQIHVGGTPTSSWAHLSSDIPTEVMPPVDVDFYLAEDAARGPFPLHYGALVETQLSPATHGAWAMADDGTLVWRLRIVSPGAYSLGLEFQSYHLPKGGQLFLYDEAQRKVLGAYTDLNERPDGGFVIEPYPGDTLVVEYDQPASATGEPDIVISTVIHDYKNVFDLMQGGSGAGPTDGSCLIDINCPQAGGWQTQKHGVMRTLSNGGLCSASLINNTANNGTPYVLTANHCGQSSNCVFLFNYEYPGCGSGNAPQDQTVSGCTVLTNNGTYDGRLLLINSAVPNNFLPYYAGWTRSTGSFTSATSIGHPSGGPKKFCTASTGASMFSAVWEMKWTAGMIQGGSSGGPLFDQNQHIRGQIWYVYVPDSCLNQTAGCGRFDQFWNANGLAQWLDPLGANPTTIDGFDPFGGPPSAPTIANLSPSSVQVFSGGLITLTGTKFIGASQVNVGSVVLTQPAGFNVIDDTKITFVAPIPTALGTVNVTVVNNVGPSNAKTLTYAETQPPQISGSPFAGAGFSYSWAYGGGVGDVAILGWSPSPTTFNLLGFDVLLSFGFVKVQLLNAIGLGGHTFLMPPGASGLTVYTQIGTIDGGSGVFNGASALLTTTIF